MSTPELHAERPFAAATQAALAEYRNWLTAEAEATRAKTEYRKLHRQVINSSENRKAYDEALRQIERDVRSPRRG